MGNTDARSLSGTSVEPLRVLIVDDNEHIRRTLTRALSGDTRFHIVGEGTDGMEGVDLARQIRPDVILMDLQMPRLDGIQATQRIKAELPDVTVVGFSSDETSAKRFLEAGASSFVPKSTPVRQLIQQISVSQTIPVPPVSDRVARFVKELTGPVAVMGRTAERLPVITYANSAFAELLGYEVEDAVGRGHEFWLLCGFDMDDLTAAISTVRRGEPWARIVQARHKDGTQLTLDVRMVPFLSADSLEVVATAQVITS